MTTITTTDVTNGTLTDATVMNANFGAIKTVVNGNIDNSNIASNADIALTKLAQTAAVSGQVIAWSGSAWVPTTSSSMPAGLIVPYAGVSVPTGFLACDGASVSKTTYSTLWAAISSSKGTVTITIASPGVVSLTSHGFVGGERVYLTTSGALPTGLSIDTDYWVIYVDANTFRLASSVTNYMAPTPINTSGSQSGTHTLVLAPYGVASSTNFKTPDLLGRTLVGNSPTANGLIRSMGLHDDRTAANRNVSHRHRIGDLGDSGTQGNFGQYNTTDVTTVYTTGDSNNQDYPAFGTVNYIVKT
jgi:hypothetical protein